MKDKHNSRLIHDMQRHIDELLLENFVLIEWVKQFHVPQFQEAFTWRVLDEKKRRAECK